jgi:hypothetical protein
MKMGALLAIPASVDLTTLGLETEPGMQLAWTLQKYGAYIVDDTWGPAFGFCAEQSNAGAIDAQFFADYGMALVDRVIHNTPWMRDNQRLCVALRVVSNNTAATIGGGPTSDTVNRLAPMACPFDYPGSGNTCTPSLVAAKVVLEAPYNPTTGLMNDALRTLGSFPLTDPYPGLGYVHMGSGNGGAVAPSVLAVSGNNAIVDWVLLELRSPSNAATIHASRSALVQRDGDVVDLDGISPVPFNVPSDNYHVAVRHRNHLGCMTTNPIALGSTATSVDLRSVALGTYGTQARKSITGSFPVEALWAGDVSFNGAVQYTGSGNDRDPILVTVGSTTPNNVVSNTYSTRDVNLNGQVKYTGSGNDRDPILVNVGSTAPNNVRTEQLP